MIDEFLAMFRRVCDYCTINRQNPNADKVQANIDGDPFGRLEKIEPLGFRSHIPAKTRALRITPNGENQDSLILGAITSNLGREPLAENELEVYIIQRQRMKYNADGSISFLHGEGENPIVNFAGNIHVSGNITCDGDVSDGTSSMQDMRDTYNSHTHTGDSGGSTSTTGDSM